MSEKITAMIEEIKGLTVLELSELVHALEEEFGVSAAAMAAPAAGAGPVSTDGLRPLRDECGGSAERYACGGQRHYVLHSLWQGRPPDGAGHLPEHPALHLLHPFALADALRLQNPSI